MAENPGTTKDKYVEVMREDIRETISSHRKHQREIVLNKNRQALGEISDSLCFSKEFILAKAQLLKKKPLPIEDYQQLQNALIQSEENINTFLKVENIIYALVRDLSGKNPVLQLYAASCCCNIALGNSKACTILGKSAAPYLIGILDTLNYPLMDVCIWTIGNLVGGSEKAFETLYAQGCLRHLVSLMCNCDISILPSVIYASIHCIHAGTQNKQYNVIDEIVPMAEILSERFSECISSNTSWLLALLSSEPACTIPLLKVVPSAVNYLYSSIADELSDVIWVTATVRLLANTIQEPSGQAAKALLNNPNYTREELHFLMNKLLSHPYIHVRKEALWMTGNLYNHQLSDVSQTVKDMMIHLPSMQLAVLSAT